VSIVRLVTASPVKFAVNAAVTGVTSGAAIVMLGVSK
jgi:hypothetical protein